MLAFGASGLSTFGDLMALPASEVERLEEYALNGPSEARTQLLLAQIVQLIGGLSGSPSPMSKLLPWFGALTKKASEAEAIDKRNRFMQRQREAQAAAMKARTR